MGTAVWQPKWWTAEKHGSTWEHVKEAMKRDWEQTKRDLSGGTAGRELDQDVDDTVLQAAGKNAIPPAGEPNTKLGTPVTKPAWSDVETPMRYGVGAHHQYGGAAWDDKLEGTLAKEWEEGRSATGKAWSDVKSYVKSGYERARS